jgi:hypothetical protein
VLPICNEKVLAETSGPDWTILDDFVYGYLGQTHICAEWKSGENGIGHHMSFQKIEAGGTGPANQQHMPLQE